MMHGVLWCSIVKVEPCGASNAPGCAVYGELFTYLLYVCVSVVCECVAVCSCWSTQYTVYSDSGMLSWVDFCR